MFRKRITKILYYSLKSLEELDTIKEVERLSIVSTEPLARTEDSNDPSEPGSCGIIDLTIVEALSADFNPSDPFWFSLLSFSSTSETLGGVTWPLISILLVLIYYFVPSSPSTLLYILAYYLFL